MKVVHARAVVDGRVAKLLLIHAVGADTSESLALLKYELDDLVAAAKAEGEAEEKRKAELAKGVGHA